MEEDREYLKLSGIQHFAFCRRQWALIHIEGVWLENVLTFEGRQMHMHVHDPFYTEKRNSLIVSRDMSVFSNRLGITGMCDVVEFRSDQNGVSLHGRTGLWLPCPVEYKREKPKEGDEDRLQLCAQALCLEEMMLCPPIKVACLYYGEIHRRTDVELSDDLRSLVEDTARQMWDVWRRQETPKVKTGKKCRNCSLYDLCVPTLMKNTISVSQYIDDAIGSDEK